MCYILLSLRTWSIYVYVNQNIITYINENIINIQSWSNINIHLQKETKYTLMTKNLLSLNFDISNQSLKFWVLGGHLVQLVKASIYQNINKYTIRT
jgi:hypothetical protein